MKRWVLIATAASVLSGCASTPAAKDNLFASMQQRITGLEQENSELRGMVERATHELEQAKKQQKELYIELDDRLSAVEGKRR